MKHNKKDNEDNQSNPNKSNHLEEKPPIDKPVFLISGLLVVAIILVLFLIPEESNTFIQNLKDGLLNNLGFIYTWVGFAAILGCLYFAFSRYGKIKFGAPDEKPEYKGFTWAATIFTAGVAAALLYWAPIEWTFYYKDPALGVEPMSALAAEFSFSYSLFHWGPIPWALYSICALPIGYSYYTRKKPVLRVSETCREVIGKQADGPLGKLFDILFMFAIILGTTTEVGLSTPLITTAVCSLFGVEATIVHFYIILAVIAVIFLIAAKFGLKDGMTRLGNTNYIVALIFIGFVLIVGPTQFIVKMATSSSGLFLENFIRMSTWMDPIFNGGFVEAWTQFYWAWWLSYGLVIGLFIARISRGRTVKSVLLGSIGLGTLGGAVFFWIMGGFTMDLHLSGTLDIFKTIDLEETYMAIVECLRQLPGSTVAIAIYALCGILFMATTFDAATTSMAAISQKKLELGKDPRMSLVIFWSVVSIALPGALLSLPNSFNALQAATVVGSLPTVGIMIVVVIAFIKMVKNDNALEIYNNPASYHKASAEAKLAEPEATAQATIEND